ncbi:MAG TPA: site-2 protease family protein [Mycobacteriales bacterium]|nr:site-2 protease family protein [Mycobacteriales bacterium]
MTAVGVLAFVFVLLTSVMLHEAGHFVTAKHYGMKATRFFVGFGPTLLSFRRGETEYGIKAIPAGGFVKIVGMTPLEAVEPGDEDRVFYKQPARQRVVVLAAGSFVHFVLAILLTYLVLVFAGDFTSTQQQVSVGGVTPCVTVGDTQRGCPPGAPAAPAQGKLLAGDRIVAVDGHPLTDPTQLTGAVTSHVGRPLGLTVIRHGARVAVSVTPVAVRQGNGTIGRIGIAVSATGVYPTYGPLAAVPRTFGSLGFYLSATGKALASLPSTLREDLAGKRSPNGALSVLGVANVSGQIASASRVPLHLRVGQFLSIMAQLNFFIGIFNLLPLLPLDGGHIAILAFEGLRRRLYRLLRRGDPGRVDINKVLPLTYAFVVLFVGVAAVLLYADIAHPLNLSG